MTEQRFWATYFALVEDVLERTADSPCAPPGASGPGLDGPHSVSGPSADGAKSTTRSAISAWEDVQHEEAGSGASPGNNHPPADDLDTYLQVSHINAHEQSIALGALQQCVGATSATLDISDPDTLIWRIYTYTRLSTWAMRIHAVKQTPPCCNDSRFQSTKSIVNAWQTVNAQVGSCGVINLSQGSQSSNTSAILSCPLGVLGWHTCTAFCCSAGHVGWRRWGCPCRAVRSRRSG
jgi:hypothetical protein